MVVILCVRCCGKFVLPHHLIYTIKMIHQKNVLQDSMGTSLLDTNNMHTSKFLLIASFLFYHDINDQLVLKFIYKRNHWYHLYYKWGFNMMKYNLKKMTRNYFEDVLEATTWSIKTMNDNITLRFFPLTDFFLVIQLYAAITFFQEMYQKKMHTQYQRIQ